MGYPQADVGDYRLFYPTQRGGRAAILDPGQFDALAPKSPRIAAHSFPQALHAQIRRLGGRRRVSKDFEREVSTISSGCDPRTREYEVEYPGGWKGDG